MTKLEAWLEEFNERAGIMEFEGGLSREEAERRAFEVVGPPPPAESGGK